MFKFKWNGEEGIELAGVGIVRQGLEFFSEHFINHPDAELLESSENTEGEQVAPDQQSEPVQEEAAQPEEQPNN